MAALHQFIDVSNDIEGLRNLLLIVGENPNGQDRQGRTPLHTAVLKSERNPQETDEILLVIRELINAGANVNLGNIRRKTPLHFAVGCRNYRITEMLLEEKADINKVDNAGDTPLHFASSRREFRGSVVRDPEIRIVKLLLKYSPDINKQNRNRETALMLAVISDHLQIVSELLKNNASVNLMDRNGNSAMHYALQLPEVNVNMVRELMRYGCSFNTCNPFDYTPMTLYFRRLLDAPRAEVEKAKYVFKLYLFGGNDINNFPLDYLTELGQRKRIKLSKFVLECDEEIEHMRIDVFESNISVYDIALRGAYFSELKKANRIPHEIYDKVIDKLIKREYPLYSDLIVEGISRNYLNAKFSEWCGITRMNDEYFNFYVFYNISQYLSHTDMLNVMLATTGGWRRYWYLPRFTYYTRCSVS